MTTKEWALGSNWTRVRHDHLFQDGTGTEPNGILGEGGFLIHDHTSSPEKHAHQLMAQWEEYPGQEYCWYGPAHELPEAISSWNLT